MHLLRPLRYLPLLVLALLAQTGTAQKISDTQKLYGLSQFWKEASYNFAYFDKVPTLNWDSTYQAFIPQVLATKTDYEYYRTLQRFCALLKDGHTNVYFPDDMPTGLDFPAVDIKPIGKRPIIVNIDKELEKTIPLGSEIVTVNGVEVIAYAQKELIPYISSSTEHVLWDNALRRLLLGPKDSTVTVRVKTPMGHLKTVTVPRGKAPAAWAKPMAQNQKQPLLEFKWLKNDIAYVALNSFSDPKIVDEFKAKLPELYKAKGLLIDIRNNGGGNSRNAAEIVKYLTQAPLLYGSAWKTRENRAAYRAWGAYVSQDRAKYESNPFYKEAMDVYDGKKWYLGDTMKIENDIKEPKIAAPVVVLTSYFTASAAEDFLIYLDYLHRATQVGQKTYGSTGQPLGFELPGGGSARICTKRDTYPDGREFVGYGVLPSVEVNPTVEGYLKGKDEVLEKGISVLQEKIKTGVNATTSR